MILKKHKLNNLTLIIPAKNEIESIDDVLKECLEYNKDLKILIIVDNNNDNTLNSHFLNSKYDNISYTISNYPTYSGAVRHGVEVAKTDFCCIYNADGSFVPHSLEDMYEFTDKFDFIYCSRYKKNGSSDDDTIITFIGNKIFTLLGKILFGVKVSDILYSYILFRRSEFLNLKLKSKDFNLALELPIMNALKKSKYIDLASHERKRFGGKKKVREFIDGYKLLKFMISIFINRSNFN